MDAANFPIVYLTQLMQDIGMVFDSKNVWANLQRKGKDLSYFDFDFDNKKNWKPFFTDKFSLDLPTCQKNDSGSTELMYYNPNMKDLWTDDADAVQQRKRFTQVSEKAIRSELEPLFEKWREIDGSGTSWMRASDVVRGMKETLKNCEVEMRGELKVKADGLHYENGGKLD